MGVGVGVRGRGQGGLGVGGLGGGGSGIGVGLRRALLILMLSVCKHGLLSFPSTTRSASSVTLATSRQLMALAKFCTACDRN